MSIDEEEDDEDDDEDENVDDGDSALELVVPMWDINAAELLLLPISDCCCPFCKFDIEFSGE